MGKNISDYKNVRGIHEGGKYSIIGTASFSGYVYLGRYAIIESGASICNAYIGRFAHIGANVVIGKTSIPQFLLMSHPVAYRSPLKFFGDDSKYLKKDRYYFENNPMTAIGHDCRILDGAFIKAGITIGRGSIIYPNSVVVSDVPPYSIVAGNPAVVIGKRFPDHICQKLSSIKLENLAPDSLFWKDKMLNFGDLSRVDLYEGRQYEEKKIRFATAKEEVPFQSNKMVIGPSHLTRWLKYCIDGDLSWPSFEIWGATGLSISSSSIDSSLDFWLSLNEQNQMIIMVPDFRIGNTELVSDERNPIFIYKGAMSLPNADVELKYRYFKRLDDWVHKYKNRVKFIFWCQEGRERINIRDGRYLNKDTGKYEHIMTMKEISSRYSENIIRVPDLDNYFSLIEPDSTIHPTLLGYKYIEALINSVE